MVKEHHISTTLPFSWMQVTQLFFQRYPNPFSTHVISCDTISRSIRPDGSLYTKRLVTKLSKVPKRGKIIYYFQPNFQPKAYVIEESLIDLKKRVIYTLTRNIGFTTKFMTIKELNFYKQDKADPERKTVVSKTATVESRFYGLRRRMEAYGVYKFGKSAVKAHQGFLYVLDQRFKPSKSDDTKPDANPSSATSKSSDNIFEKYCNMYNVNCSRLLARFLAKIS